MLVFDSNKSLIVVEQGQSNIAGRGLWNAKSTTGLYAPYASLQGLTVAPNLYTSQNMIPGSVYNSNIAGDLFELGNLSAWGSSEGSNSLGISMGFSFIVDLMAYLNSISYTKNVWYLRHGYGGTNLLSVGNEKDWNPANKELLFESMNNTMDIVDYEKQVNGNDSQVIILWHQGESTAAYYSAYQTLLSGLYNYQAKVFGTPHHLFMGQVVPKNANSIALNAAIAAYTVENPNAHMVGEDLSGGLSTWEKMEADDPDGIILASTPTSYTTGGDVTHYNWSAQILQGKQLYDLVFSKFLTS